MANLATPEQMENLEKITKKVWKDSKFEKISASFVEKDDMKINWKRQGKDWLDIEMTDYLADASDETIESIMRFIRGKFENPNNLDTMPEEVRIWASSEEFAKKHQKIYIERKKNLNPGKKGDRKDLGESLNRIEKLNIIEIPKKLKVLWGDTTPNFVNYSVAMRTLFVSRVLDDKDVPNYVIDYLIYNHIARISLGLDSAEKIEKKMDELESKYPMYKEAKKWLDKNIPSMNYYIGN